jgi:hypothetical protein
MFGAQSLLERTKEVNKWMELSAMAVDVKRIRLGLGSSMTQKIVKSLSTKTGYVKESLFLM